MIKLMYSVYDKKAKLYGTPFYSSHLTIAIRSFTRLVNDRNHDIFLFAQDFALYELGGFDDEKCQFETSEPKLICEASSVKEEVI